MKFRLSYKGRSQAADRMGSNIDFSAIRAWLAKVTHIVSERLR